MIGVNDLWLLKSSKDDILKNYSAILTYLQMKTPDTKIYIQSMLPVNNIDFANFKVDNKDIVFLNEQLKQMAKSFNYKYIDLHSHFVNQAGELSAGYTDDGVHLNGRGYSQWRDLIKNYVNN
jgi:lysophospholipase L1-like esterase